jgi:hypothetical protein
MQVTYGSSLFTRQSHHFQGKIVSIEQIWDYHQDVAVFGDGVSNQLSVGELVSKNISGDHNDRLWLGVSYNELQKNVKMEEDR